VWGKTWSRLEVSVRAEQVHRTFGVHIDDIDDILLPRTVTTTTQPDLEPGLRARIGDPLWMLSRQWQVGEFRGEDAASPVQVKATVATTKPGVFMGKRGTSALPATGMLLEPHVEAEALGDGPGAFGRTAEAGLHFLRLLDAEGVGTLRGKFRQKYPLQQPTMSPMVDTDTRRRVRLLARRSLDARAFATALVDGLATAMPSGVTSTQQPKVAAAIRVWSVWLSTRFLEPPPVVDGTWTSDHMEYNFALAAPGSTGPVELRAAEYPGGHLNWYNFDVVPGSTAAVENVSLTVATVQMLPSSVRYRGMPVRRWWPFEEGTVQLGMIAAGPTDPARLVVAEFATVFGDDCYLIPIPLTANTLVRVRDVEVTDTFGKVVPLRSCAEVDGPARTWRFFELTGDDSVDRHLAPWVYLAPAIVGGVEASPVEQVVFARDEGANLAWAIERRIESPLGEAIDRREAARRSGTAPERAAGAWRYRVESPTPPHWIPLVPVVQGGKAQYKLRRGTMEQWQLLGVNAAAGAQGTLLEPAQPLYLCEEEVPSEGIVVTRAWQMARNTHGSLLVWLGRRKRVGKGEARSGLRYDRILGTGGER
jgi:hypothetical protein